MCPRLCDQIAFVEKVLDGHWRAYELEQKRLLYSR